MPRESVCDTCGRPWIFQGERGIIPANCDNCRDPVWLRQTVKLLLAMAVEEHRPIVAMDASRETLTRAVRDLAKAVGREQTKRALLNIRDIAATWASLLSLAPAKAPGAHGQQYRGVA